MQKEPNFRASAWFVVVGACAFMALSAALAGPGWERAFRSDASPVSWLSSALLMALCVMAMRLRADSGLPRGLGAWLALAMFALALDEQFMFHELWKYRCEELTALCAHAAVRELPMLAVGVVGALTVGLLHRALRSGSPASVLGLMWAGLAVGLWAIVVDQVPMPYPVAKLEEAFEVLAESLVLAALLGTPPGPQVQSSSSQSPARNH